MEDQTEIEQVVPTPVPGVGEFQSKLAEGIRSSKRALQSAFMLERKRHGIHQHPLAAGIKAMDALEEACQLFVHCMNDHEAREQFASDVLEKLS